MSPADTALVSVIAIFFIYRGWTFWVNKKYDAQRFHSAVGRGHRPKE